MYYLKHNDNPSTAYLFVCSFRGREVFFLFFLIYNVFLKFSINIIGGLCNINNFDCSKSIFSVLGNIPTRKIPTRNILIKKMLCSYAATLVQFVTCFGCVWILNSRPGGSREVLVGVSESGFYFTYK